MYLAALPHTCLVCLVQNAEQYRVRALDVIEKLQHLTEFAHARDPSDLPQLFHQDARMAEAAVSAWHVGAMHSGRRLAAWMATACVLLCYGGGGGGMLLVRDVQVGAAWQRLQRADCRGQCRLSLSCGLGPLAGPDWQTTWGGHRGAERPRARGSGRPPAAAQWAGGTRPRQHRGSCGAAGAVQECA